MSPSYIIVKCVRCGEDIVKNNRVRTFICIDCRAREAAENHIVKSFTCVRCKRTYDKPRKRGIRKLCNACRGSKKRAKDYRDKVYSYKMIDELGKKRPVNVRRVRELMDNGWRIHMVKRLPDGYTRYILIREK